MVCGAIMNEMKRLEISGWEQPFQIIQAGLV